MTALRVLGIDPGSRITGVGVVEADGQALRHIHSACIRVGEGDLGPRLARIYRGVADVIDQHGPERWHLNRFFWPEIRTQRWYSVTLAAAHFWQRFTVSGSLPNTVPWKSNVQWWVPVAQERHRCSTW